MKKYDILENIRVEKLIFGWSGLATAPDGKKIIIAWWAIPEAMVDLRITKVKNNRLEAQIARTVKKSPLEKDIPTEWQLYGGCKWLMIPYEKQIEIKEEQIKEAFHFLKEYTKDTAFHSIIRSPESENYRNKVEFSWGKYISEREWVHDDYRFWFHVQGQFDRIEDCWYCVLASNTVNAIFRDIDSFARAYPLPTYDPKTWEGFWRHLVIREAKKTNEIMILWSLNTDFSWFNTTVKQDIEVYVETLVSRYPQIQSVYMLHNTGRADIVTGEEEILYGESTITEELLGFTFEIQPKSFFQVNTLGAEKLYTCAIDSIHSKNGILFDLYAWTGTIGILLAKNFEKVYSVEMASSSSRDGEKNAKRNQLSNIEFINAKVEDFVRDFQEKNSQETPEQKKLKQKTTIVLDPPRDWLHPSAIPHILSFAADEIIYVSCNPGTLTRDIAVLINAQKPQSEEILEGDETWTWEKKDISVSDTWEKVNTTPKCVYKITDITPVDMFPHTHHIETVVRLERLP
jgi:23S rRNA (uracil1939-C5)-methyltransferase